MAKTLNYGTLGQEFSSGYAAEYREAADLEDAIIVAARDGSNIALLKAFARGNYSEDLSKFPDLMARVLYTAHMNQHDDVIKAILDENPQSIEAYDSRTLGYDHIADIHAELSGESSDSADSSGGGDH